MESAVEVAEILVADFCQSIIALERVGGRKLLVQPQHFEPLPYFSYVMALGKAIVELQVKPQFLVVEISKILIKLRRLYRIILLSQLCKLFIIGFNAALGRDKEQVLAVVKQSSQGRYPEDIREGLERHKTEIASPEYIDVEGSILQGKRTPSALKA